MRKGERREAAARLVGILSREADGLTLLSVSVVHEARKMLANRLVNAGADAAEVREAMDYQSLGAARGAIHRARFATETPATPLSHS